MVGMIRWVSSILAIISLIMLWRAQQYNILWWVILTLFILDWLTGEAVRNAAKMGSGEGVIKFWAVVNMFISPACLITSIVGIVLSRLT